MSISSESVREKTEDMMLALVEQFSRSRQEKRLSQGDVAKIISMDKGQFSRLLRAPNMRLDTAAKLSLAVGEDLLVTPLDYVEHLLNNRQRLTDIVKAAIKVDPQYADELQRICDRLAQPDGACLTS